LLAQVLAELLDQDPWRGTGVLRTWGPGLLARIRALPWYVRATPIPRDEWVAVEMWDGARGEWVAVELPPPEEMR